MVDQPDSVAADARGLLGVMLFMLPAVAESTNDPAVAEYGGPIPFAMAIGQSVFFEMGTLAMAIGVIVICQDAIVDEKNSGIAEWLLSKPVSRSSYIISKLIANAIAVVPLLIVVPAVAAYGMFYLRIGEILPILPYLTAVGIQALHTLFYLALVVLTGVFFNNRAPILGLTFGELMGGLVLGGVLTSLMMVMPWPLAKFALAIVSGAQLPAKMVLKPVLFTAVWSVVFVIIALWRFEKSAF